MRCKKRKWACLGLLSVLFCFFPVYFAESEPVRVSFPGEERRYENGSESQSDDIQTFRELFKLYADIELMESRMEKMHRQLEEIEGNIRVAENSLFALRTEMEAVLGQYAEMLRTRQKNGEGAVLKILFRSRDLREFMFRMRLAQDMNAAYRRMVGEVDGKVDAENRLRDTLLKARQEAVSKKHEMESAIEIKRKNAEALEDYLESKGADKALFEAELARLSRKWRKLKPMFSEAVGAFVELIESGGLPNEVVEVHASLFGVRGKIREEVFNRLLDQAMVQKQTTEMKFRVADGGVYVYVPEHEVELFGTFDTEPTALLYRVTSGRFCGIEMSDTAIEDLFMGGNLRFDISYLLDIMSMRLKDCKTGEGFLDIGIEFQ